jgi:hypothetical protein
MKQMAERTWAWVSEVSEVWICPSCNRRCGPDDHAPMVIGKIYADEMLCFRCERERRAAQMQPAECGR